MSSFSKTFNGVKYVISGHFTTKEAAIANAKWLRKWNYYARVVKARGIPGYNVYMHKKSNIHR